MSLRGSRRVQVLLGLVVVAVIAIAVVVLATGGEDRAYDEPVARSTVREFPTRGPLAEDEDVVEAAADVWREGDRYRVKTKPQDEIQVLWAGEVEADAVKGLVTDKDTPKNVRVVVLRSGDEVATFAERQIDSDHTFDSLGIEELDVDPAPLLRVPGDLTLTSDQLPDSYEAVDEAAVTLTLQADDGLISSTSKGIALRLEETGIRDAGRDVPGIFIGGRVLRFDADDASRVWSLLSLPAPGEAVRELMRTLVPTGSGGLSLAEVELVLESKAPGGRTLLVATATGQGVGPTRRVAAVDYDSTQQGPIDVVSLGGGDSSWSWVGSGWVTPEDRTPYFIAVGGKGTERVEVFLGRQSERLDAPGGVVVPDAKPGGRTLPPVVVAGFTEDGTVVPTLPRE